MVRLDKKKYLNKLRFKKSKRYIYLGISCLLVIFIGIYYSYSRYSVSKDTEVVKTTVGDFISGDVVIGAYIDGEYSKSIPGKNDGYIVDKIVCDNDASASWDYNDWGILVNNLTKRTKCNIYFHKDYLATIITQVDTTGKCPTVNNDGMVVVSSVEADNSLVCSAPDDYGTSFYFRGNVTNNYVKFAGFYWRIIRLNGDGTIRMIYDGTSAHTNDDTSEDRLIGKSAYNAKNDDNAYVGYMYGTIGASSYAETHANKNDSVIKKYIDTWYENNIKNTEYEQYIGDNIFCNNRKVSTYNSNNFVNSGYGSVSTFYVNGMGPWSAPSDTLNAKMYFTCLQENDKLSVINSKYGTKTLKYGIGLITRQELVLSGYYNNSATDKLYTNSGIKYYTMSPDAFNNEAGWKSQGTYIRAFNGIASTTDSIGVKPVINLKAGSITKGQGTISSPYEI